MLVKWYHWASAALLIFQQYVLPRNLLLGHTSEDCKVCDARRKTVQMTLRDTRRRRRAPGQLELDITRSCLLHSYRESRHSNISMLPSGLYLPSGCDRERGTWDPFLVSFYCLMERKVLDEQKQAFEISGVCPTTRTWNKVSGDSRNIITGAEDASHHLSTGRVRTHHSHCHRWKPCFPFYLVTFS